MVHRLDLRNGLVRFVDEEQVILRHVIEQRGRRFARQAAGHVARIILDAVAISDGADHLDVEHGSLPHSLRLDEFALLLELRLPPRQLFQDGAEGALLLLGRHDVVRFRIDGQARQRLAPTLRRSSASMVRSASIWSPHISMRSAWSS